jgi:hypothetical protein
MKSTAYISVKTSVSKIFITCLLCLVAVIGFAQDKTKTIGNKAREGSANTSFSAVKDAQVGIQMNAGHKPVQLLKLNFHVANHASDSIAFKVNVYKMSGKLPADSNFVATEIKGTIPKYDKGEHKLVSVDLSPFNVVASGQILVSIEFLTTKNGADISFASGLLNGGTFHKDSSDEKWKKIPVVGADFNVLVKKLK